MSQEIKPFIVPVNVRFESQEGYDEFDREAYEAQMEMVRGEDEVEEFYYDVLDDQWEEDTEDDEEDWDDDGQPSEYEEWQDYYGGDDWDHGQYDGMDYDFGLEG